MCRRVRPWYEVTTRQVHRVRNYRNAVSVKDGPLTYYAASYGTGGKDFRLDSAMSTEPEHRGSCEVGPYTSPLFGSK